MPELPETETIARDLNELVSGGRIVGTEVFREDVLRRVTAVEISGRLSGAAIVRVWRRAKTVVMELSSTDHILVQPRFTGVLRTREQGDDASDLYATVSLRLEDGRRIVYADVRRLGTFAVLSLSEFRHFDSALGVEPLDGEFTTQRLSGLLRSSNRAVKVVLMDQRRVAGIGNIYANEALWRAGIDPSRAAASLSASEAGRIREGVVSVLVAAVAARGTTFRDYRDARGERGAFAEQLAVYGRADAPCLECAARLVETHAIDGRSTVFCYRCQR